MDTIRNVQNDEMMYKVNCFKGGRNSALKFDYLRPSGISQKF